MQQFEYVIRDALGIHARPAGLLAKAARSFPEAEITVEKDGVSVRAVQLMKLMGLGVRRGDRVVVRAEGPQEAEAIAAMKAFFEENL